MKQSNPYSLPGLKKYNDLQTIIKTVVAHFGITENQLYEKTRKNSIVEPRRVVFFLVRKNQIMSIHKLAFIFGMNHATCLYHIKVFENLFDHNRDFNQKVKDFI